MATKKTKEHKDIVMTPLVVCEMDIEVVGTAPLMINAWGNKGPHLHAPKQSKMDRPARDLEDECNAARHISKDGWDGVAAGSFRLAAVRAAKMTGMQMTDAKLLFMIVAEGEDAADGTQLVRINAGPPETDVRVVRLKNGSPDLRARPKYFPWSAKLRIRYPSLAQPETIIQLIDYAGAFVGVGEGRPFSTNSGGIEMGTFRVKFNEGR